MVLRIDSGSSVNIVILTPAAITRWRVRARRRGAWPEIRNAPQFIAHSTAPGQTAVDGKGKNSPTPLAPAAAIVTLALE